MRSVFHKIGFFTAFIVPVVVVTGFYLGGYWNFLGLGLAFILMPIADHLSGIDKTNFPDEQVRSIADNYYYRFITYLWTYLQIGFLFWGAWAVTSGKLHGILEWAGFIIGFSLVTGGVGITVAHELGHKKSPLERLYSKTLLMTVCYMHYYIEHNKGHHILVATPQDAATARRGQNFYAFWIQSVFGGYRHAWKIEADRLQKKGLPLISRHNEMILFTLMPLVFCLILFCTVSLLLERVVWEIPVMFFAQSFFAITLLELVNYVEHYGIVRREITPGKFERVNPLHSWNASHVLSNFFLFQVQRHSDHHVTAHKRYQVLNHYDESPQLPFGYPTMILLALVPPIWFGMMDKRLDQWKEKTTMVSIEP